MVDRFIVGNQSTTMGANRSRPEQIHRLLGAGCTYRFIAHEFHCSFSSISDARTPSDVTPKQMGRPKKITPEISSFIETVSRLDACLTHQHIANLIHQRWPNVTLSIAIRPRR
jgi:hypothetical protein